MRQSSKCTAMEWALKGDSKPGHRQIKRGLDDQNPRPRRCPRQLGSVRCDACQPLGYSWRCAADQGRGIRRDARGQGLRQQLDCRGHERCGAKMVISQRLQRKEPLEIDEEMYKWRHLIENYFQKLKEFKHIAMRSDKTDASYNAMINRGMSTRTRLYTARLVSEAIWSRSRRWGSNVIGLSGQRPGPVSDSAE